MLSDTNTVKGAAWLSGQTSDS